jgi:hypothetical protein
MERFCRNAHRLISLIGLAALCPAVAGGAEDLLPDMTVRESELLRHDHVTNGDRVLLRFANGTPNIGKGPLHVVGVLPANPDGTQNVNQRVFRDDGSHYDRPAGRFEFHPGHDHVHLEGWAIYRLRARLPDGGVGEVLRESGKTSFCLLDSASHDATLPGYEPLRTYRSCGELFQGISVGWVDIYEKDLIGQNIDVAGLPPGTYWLESEVDPDDHILELDEGNNLTRIEVELTEPLFIDGPLEFAPEDHHSHDHHRPDLRLGPGPDPTGHLGNDVYESGGRGTHSHGGHLHFDHDPAGVTQLLRLTSSKGRVRSFFTSIQNESGESQACHFRCGGVTRELRVVHFETSGPRPRNITAGMNGRGSVLGMASDELKTFRTKVSPARISKSRAPGGRPVRAALRLRAWYDGMIDEGRVFLTFR